MEPRGRVPAGRPTCATPRRAVHARRDDHRVPLAPGRRAVLLRYRARPVHLRQSDGNGFSLSALAGRREIMELGGLRTERERVFLLSTTHGGETPRWPPAWRRSAEYQAHDVIGISAEPARRSAKTSPRRHSGSAWIPASRSLDIRRTSCTRRATRGATDHSRSARSFFKRPSGVASDALPGRELLAWTRRGSRDDRGCGRRAPGVRRRSMRVLRPTWSDEP